MVFIHPNPSRRKEHWVDGQDQNVRCMGAGSSVSQLPCCVFELTSQLVFGSCSRARAALRCSFTLTHARTPCSPLNCLTDSRRVALRARRRWRTKSRASLASVLQRHELRHPPRRRGPRCAHPNASLRTLTCTLTRTLALHPAQRSSGGGRHAARRRRRSSHSTNSGDTAILFAAVVLGARSLPRTLTRTPTLTRALR